MPPVPISQNVNVSVIVSGSTAAVAGFGVPLILSPDATALFDGGEYVREYSATADMLTDGFTTSMEAYKAAVDMVAQSPRPATWKVGAIPTSNTAQVQIITWDIDFVTSNSIAAAITVNGTTSNLTQAFTVDQATTIAALEVQIEAITGIVSSVSAARAITITSDPDILYSGLVTIGAITVTLGASQAVETVTTSVAASYEDAWLTLISADDDAWYCALYPDATGSTQADANQIYRLAAAIESVRKIFIAQSAQAVILSGGAAAISQLLADLNYNRTALIYHGTSTDHLAAAWVGKQLGWDFEARANAWGRATLSSVTSDDMTSAQRAAIVADDGNYYAEQGGSDRVFNGTMASGRYIDLQTTADLTQARLEEGLLDVLNAAADSGEKIPFTDGGIGLLAGSIRQTMATLTGAGHFTEFVPTSAVKDWLTSPTQAGASSADKAARTLDPFTAERTLTGAIGTMSLTVIAVI